MFCCWGSTARTPAGRPQKVGRNRIKAVHKSTYTIKTNGGPEAERTSEAAYTPTTGWSTDELQGYFLAPAGTTGLLPQKPRRFGCIFRYPFCTAHMSSGAVAMSSTKGTILPSKVKSNDFR